ncbi:MAG TPA: integrase arm-type DNA-binding domain-containing protein [Burkholderiales bacterium]|nr:integrase arm-type DNA-binding domain-containing protein [Burkholderiales bacterium]
MSKRQLNRLSARTILTKKRPGLYCDGGGLYLQVTPTGSKTWIFRYRSPLTKKLRYMGLGSVRAVGLPEARTKAAAQRGLISQGIDPISARNEEIERKAMEAAKALTFGQCATAYIESHRAGWKSAKHAGQWTETLNTFAGPIIGTLPVQAVDTGLVLKILEPIWAKLPETASRLRGRIEAVLDWAKARGHRSGENPARWKGHLNQLLPALARKSRAKHYAALPYEQIGEFVTRLRALDSVGALALEFTILTAARTGEVIGAKPEEIDLDKAIWTVPAERMKAGREHRVPLSPRALEIARKMLELKGTYLFPGRGDKRQSNMTMLAVLKRMGRTDITVHGFRSSFRDWAAEQTAWPREVCEMALAHTITDKTEAAYRRGDLFEKRRALMGAWAEFIDRPPSEGTVIPLRQVA